MTEDVGTIPHGTARGASAHRRAGTKPCPDCSKADSKDQLAWSVRAGRQHNVRITAETLGLLAGCATAELLARLADEVGERTITECQLRAQHGGPLPRTRYGVGETHSRAKLSEAQVREIRLRAAAGESKTALGREHGVKRTTIRAIVERRTWTHVA